MSDQKLRHNPYPEMPGDEAYTQPADAPERAAQGEEDPIMALARILSDGGALDGIMQKTGADGSGTDELSQELMQELRSSYGAELDTVPADSADAKNRGATASVIQPTPEPQALTREPVHTATVQEDLDRDNMHQPDIPEVMAPHVEPVNEPVTDDLEQGFSAMFATERGMTPQTESVQPEPTLRAEPSIETPRFAAPAEEPFVAHTPDVTPEPDMTPAAPKANAFSFDLGALDDAIAAIAGGQPAKPAQPASQEPRTQDPILEEPRFMAPEPQVTPHVEEFANEHDGQPAVSATEFTQAQTAQAYEPTRAFSQAFAPRDDDQSGYQAGYQTEEQIDEQPTFQAEAIAQDPEPVMAEQSLEPQITAESFASLLDDPIRADEQTVSPVETPEPANTPARNDDPFADFDQAFANVVQTNRSVEPDGFATQSVAPAVDMAQTGHTPVEHAEVEHVEHVEPSIAPLEAETRADTNAGDTLWGEPANATTGTGATDKVDPLAGLGWTDYSPNRQFETDFTAQRPSQSADDGFAYQAETVQAAEETLAEVETRQETAPTTAFSWENETPVQEQDRSEETPAPTVRAFTAAESDADILTAAKEAEPEFYKEEGTLPPHTPKNKIKRLFGENRGLAIAASLVGIVVVGGAAAVGYNASGNSAGPAGPVPIIEADGGKLKEKPKKVANKTAEDQKKIYARIEGTQTGEKAKLVSRETKVSPLPVDPDATRPGVRKITTDNATTPLAPKRVKTVSVRPDGTIIDLSKKPAQPTQVAQAETGAKTVKTVTITAPTTGATPPATPTPVAPAPVAPKPAAVTTTPVAAVPAAPQTPQTPQNAVPAGSNLVSLPKLEVPLPPVKPAPPKAQITAVPTPPVPAVPTARKPVRTVPLPTAAPTPKPAQRAVTPTVPANTGRPTPQPTNLLAATGQPKPVQPAKPAQGNNPLNIFGVGGKPAQPKAVAPQPVATSPAVSGGYVVQLASQRSPEQAQATFRKLQGRFPGILGSQTQNIQRADLGDRGIYYRLRVGPMLNKGQAQNLCANLKRAGGDCIVKRN